MNSLSIPQHLSIPMLKCVDNRNNLRVMLQALLLFLGHKTPQFVDINDGAPMLVAREMEVAHTDFSKVTRMIFIEVGSVS